MHRLTHLQRNRESSKKNVSKKNSVKVYKAPSKMVSATTELIPEVKPSISTNIPVQYNLTLPKPKRKAPDNPNVAKLNKLNDDLNNIISRSLTLIERNKSNPEISEGLLKPCIILSKVVPPFYTVSLDFFHDYQKLQEVITHKQIISSQVVFEHMMAFNDAWRKYHDSLLTINDFRNFPYSHFIRAKLDRIKNTFDIILNSKKEHLDDLVKTIHVLKELCDNIVLNIIDLFEQPNFHFKGEKTYILYKNNVKSFLRIVVNAFQSKMPLSGMLSIDLNRHKSSIQMNCAEIIDSLKMAFDFPREIHSLIELSDTIYAQVEYLGQQFQFPNNVVHPLPENKLPEVDHIPKQETIEVNQVNDEIIDENELIDQILERIFTKLNTDVSNNKLIHQKLLCIEENIDRMLHENSVMGDENKMKTKRIEKLQDIIKDLELKLTDNSELVKLFDAKTIKYSKDLESQVRNITDENISLKQKIISLEMSLGNAISVESAELMKQSLIEVGVIISKKFNTPNVINTSDTETEIVNSIYQMLDNSCPNCETLEKKLKDIKIGLQDITGVNEHEDLYKYISIIGDQYKKYESDIEFHKNNLQQMTKVIDELVETNGSISNEMSEYTLQYQSLFRLQNKLRDFNESLMELQKVSRLKDNDNDRFLHNMNEIIDVSFVVTESMDLKKKLHDNIIRLIEVKNDFFDKYEALREKMNDKNSKIKKYKEFLMRYMKVKTGKDIIKEIEKSENSIDISIKALKEEIVRQQDDLRSLCLRVYGVTRLDPKSTESIRELYKSTLEILDALQDDREELLKEHTYIKQDYKLFRNSLIFTAIHLGSHLNAGHLMVDALSNRQLMERVDDLVNQVCRTTRQS